MRLNFSTFYSLSLMMKSHESLQNKMLLKLLLPTPLFSHRDYTKSAFLISKFQLRLYISKGSFLDI